MTKGGKVASTTDEGEIQALLNKIDGMEVLAGQSKRAKLEDVVGEITRVESELVGMRRALVQHRKPNARIDQNGQTLSGAIIEAVRQLERLREYREEVRALPDDEPGEDVKGGDQDGD